MIHRVFKWKSHIKKSEMIKKSKWIRRHVRGGLYYALAAFKLVALCFISISFGDSCKCMGAGASILTHVSLFIGICFTFHIIVSFFSLFKFRFHFVSVSHFGLSDSINSLRFTHFFSHSHTHTHSFSHFFDPAKAGRKQIFTEHHFLRGAMSTWACSRMSNQLLIRINALSFN